MKNNLINTSNKKRINENNDKLNHPRYSSVEERYNNNHRFPNNSDKEYLDIRFLVKKSVEKINTLFNKEEFKNKTTSKKMYRNIAINNTNIKDNNSTDLDIKKENKIDTLKFLINNVDRDKDKDKNKFLVKEEEGEYINNNNNLDEELKELKKGKSILLKNENCVDNDSVNASLLNLESNRFDIVFDIHGWNFKDIDVPKNMADQNLWNMYIRDSNKKIWRTINNLLFMEYKSRT